MWGWWVPYRGYPTPPTFCAGIKSSASISGSSVVLTRLDGDDVPKKKRSAKPASGRQEHAFMALQNLIIDRGEKVVRVADWNGGSGAARPRLGQGESGSGYER